jgi:trans-aconitate methyltransferase
MLLDPFNRTRMPGDVDREGRVRMLGEFAEAALSGRQPSQAEMLFVAGAVFAWLENSGSLERHYLRVTKPKSHFTPQVIWRRIKASSAMSDRAADRGDTDATFRKESP